MKEHAQVMAHLKQPGLIYHSLIVLDVAPIQILYGMFMFPAWPWAFCTSWDDQLVLH